MPEETKKTLLQSLFIASGYPRSDYKHTNGAQDGFRLIAEPQNRGGTKKRKRASKTRRTIPTHCIGFLYCSYKTADGAEGGFGLIAEPDVVVEAVSEGDEMVVLATDGVFEVMSNEEVVEFIKAAG